jgi:hypothetical protein
MTTRVVSPSVIGLMLVVGVNVWLLTVIAAHIVSNDSAVVGRSDWTPNLSKLVEDSRNRKSIGAYNQILMQPIFFKSREPFQAPPPVPPAPLMASPLPLILDLCSQAL